MTKMTAPLAIIAATAGLLAAPAASGQDRERGVTISERQRPEVDPLGVRGGSALWWPRLTLYERYNDNIFAVNDNSTGDFITVIEPSFGGTSDWNQHALNFQAQATIGRFAQNESENYVDATVETDGRLDITRASDLEGRASYARRHVARGSPNDVNGVAPTVFDVSSVVGTYTRNEAQLSLQVEGALERINFDDVASETGTINNDDRDRSDISGQLRVGYEVVPRYEAFVRGGVNTRPYDENRDDNGFARSSHGYEVVAGADVDLTGITFINAFAGYRFQDYEDRRLGNISGPMFGGEFIWNGELTTLTASVTRTIEQTIIPGSAGFFATRSGMRVEHELRRNLVLEGGAFYQTGEFEGIAFDERRYELSFVANYKLNRHLHTYLEYNYAARDAEQAGGIAQDFAQNRAVLGVELNY